MSFPTLEASTALDTIQAATASDWTMKGECECSRHHKVTVSWLHSALSEHPHDMAVGCLVRCPDCARTGVSEVMFMPFSHTPFDRTDDLAEAYVREIAGLGGEVDVLPTQLQSFYHGRARPYNLTLMGPDFVKKGDNSPGGRCIVNGDSSQVLRLSVFRPSRTKEEGETGVMYLEYTSFDETYLPKSTNDRGRKQSRSRSREIFSRITGLGRQLTSRIRRPGRRANMDAHGDDVTPTVTPQPVLAPTTALNTMPEHLSPSQDHPAELETTLWSAPTTAARRAQDSRRSDDSERSPVEMGESYHDSCVFLAQEAETTVTAAQPPEASSTPYPSALAGPYQTHLHPDDSLFGPQL